MDLTLILALFSAIILIFFGVLIFIKSSAPKKSKIKQEATENRRENVPRRTQIVRNQRARLRANAARHEDVIAEDNVEDEKEVFDDKIGTKKRAKLEAKAERKAQREAEQKLREDKKKQDKLEEEERLKRKEIEEAEAKQREEEERKAQEEKERREHEEYLKMKQAFSVEEEGFEESEQEGKNSLEDFVNYVKNNKVVVIEDLAAHFKLKTQAVIDRLQDLQNDNILSGVIDDRGKFIYISKSELESVVKFIKQRGRISINELAESSNKLIDLNPKMVSVNQ